MRLHIKTGFRPEDIKKIEAMTAYLNKINWQYTRHCLDQIKNRNINLENLLLYIRDYKLQAQEVFEVYINSAGQVDKICYRFKYTEDQDIIIVLGSNKQIITVWTNNKTDLHFTLDLSLYDKVNCYD